MTEKPVPTPNLWREQERILGLANRIKVMRKQNRIPPNRMKDNSRPEALTMGVSKALIKVWITKRVSKMPKTEVTTGTIAYIESHLMYCSGSW